MRVTDADARHFYEAEAVRANWSRRDLERQINSLYHQRLLASADKTGVRQGHQDIGQMDGYVRLYEEQHRLEVIFNHQDVHGESVSRGALRFAKGSVMHNSEGHDKDCENASIQNFALLMRHSRRLFRR
jgi:hypothetical protein